ncbi:MAG TPA: hypothetical protein VHE35_15995, partial [Kofleriaceae bacterium]|nr:hypothetical protein [Kofleriaceae bacterium]
ARAWAAAEPPPSPELVAAWAKVEQAWEDPAAHDRAAAIALEHGAMPWLARRYREVQRARPADAVARGRIDRIAFMSVAALKATAAPPTARRARGRTAYIVLLVLAVVVAGALLAARATTVHHSGKRRPAIPADHGGHPAPRPAPGSIEPPPPGR